MNKYETICNFCIHKKVCEYVPNFDTDCTDYLEERPQGEWIEEYTTEICHSFLGYRCSVCNVEALELNDYSYKSNFCPNCGADMRGDNYEIYT